MKKYIDILLAVLLIVFAVISGLLSAKVLTTKQQVLYEHGVTVIPSNTTQADDYKILEQINALSQSLRAASDYFAARKQDAALQITEKWKLKKGVEYEFDKDKGIFVEANTPSGIDGNNGAPTPTAFNSIK